MTIEQTRFFIDEVNHATNFAKEYRHLTTWEEHKNALINGLERMRGKDTTQKILKKANQKLKAKVY